MFFPMNANGHIDILKEVLAVIAYPYKPTASSAETCVDGFSPGLKKCPPDTFLPLFHRGRPLRIPPSAIEKAPLMGCFFDGGRWDSKRPTPGKQG